jgi:hypothetical protein
MDLATGSERPFRRSLRSPADGTFRPSTTTPASCPSEPSYATPHRWSLRETTTKPVCSPHAMHPDVPRGISVIDEAQRRLFWNLEQCIGLS